MLWNDKRELQWYNGIMDNTIETHLNKQVLF